MSSGPRPTVAFPNYLEMPTRVPLRFWLVVRYGALVAYLGVMVALVARPSTWLSVFWGLLVPVLPLVFLVAPGSWRNVCPLAAANQAPRLRGLSRAAPAPAWLRQYGFALAMAGFAGCVLLRKVLLNANGAATAAALGVVLAGASAGGYLLKGKSGWCSSLCPLLPVQRIYGQSPFVGVPNAHCRPCVGCTKNCYDFNPRVGYLADMNDPDLTFRGHRRFFAGAFPGLVLGYFVVPDAGTLSIVEVVARTSLWVAASVAVFVLLDTFGRFAANTLPPLFAAVAFGSFYWFGSERVAAALEKLTSRSWTWIEAPVRVGAVVLAVVWLARSRRAQRRFLDEAGEGDLGVHVDLGKARRAAVPAVGDEVVVSFAGAASVPVPVGTSLLDAAEAARVRLPSGCRMGVCGADPVAVLEGVDALSPVRREEADTLERLGLGGSNRMACMARVEGPCTVALEPDRSSAPVPSAPAFTPDPAVARVVVVGNGIAGVTVADFVRRSHPDCAIDILGDEAHELYNRMAIGRLIHGREGMKGLYLLPEDWYDAHRVTSWLNTRVTDIDREARCVRLGTGESLPYDRLVIATGARSTVPEIEGFGMPGTFVLREAADAIGLRQHVQHLDRRTAVVAGGGLLGLEAAHALHQLGLTTVVAERSDRLLRRQLDPTASEVLREYLELEGIRIATGIEVRRVVGPGRVQEVETTDGRLLPCDVLLVAAGITPNVGLARRAGLEVGRAVVVDDHLRSSDPHIYAVGDAAEFDGHVWGLWPVAVEQGRIAAHNIAGGDERYVDEVPPTMLKGVGLDMLSFGVVEAGEADLAVVERPAGEPAYRKVVLRAGRVVGGVFLGFADTARAARAAHDEELVLDDAAVQALRAGDWSALEGRVPSGV